MPSTHTLVIGAGQAGLAMSRCLTEVGADHVVLERGRTAERWHSERWDSLRLLTPNWAARLPGWQYRGPHPDGYMSAGELAAYLTDYAASFDAPIEHDSEVQAVTRAEHGFAVRAGDVTWTARNVVLATGWCDRPRVPALAAGLHPSIRQCTPSAYRCPDDLPPGGVLVVGAAATGVQLADELARAGRDVVLAVGRHSRAPRRYRGMDIWWWLDRIGTFATTIDRVSDPARSRAEGAIQLVGRDDHRDVDLAALHALGVRLTGRLTAIDGLRASFAADLATTTADADERLARLLGQIDEHIADHGLTREVLPAVDMAPLPAVAPIPALDLRADGITTVLWATGYRRHHPWLHVPVLDRSGEVAQRRGVTPVDGLYVLGQRFQHRRDSNFIDGVRHDAIALTHHLVDRFPQPTH
jgi:putative flavoprotein involved in K+ transport